MSRKNGTGLIIYRGVFIAIIVGAIFSLFRTHAEQIRMREQVNNISEMFEDRIEDQKQLQKQIKYLELRILTIEYDMYRSGDSPNE